MLHTYHRPRLTQWDALYVQYGVAFYTLPKISPLQYLQGLLGSGIIVSAYLWLLVFVRPMPVMELLLTVFYLVPSLYLFNHLAYATEKAARERCVRRVACNEACGVRCMAVRQPQARGSRTAHQCPCHHLLSGLRCGSVWVVPTSTWTSIWRNRAAPPRRCSRASG